MVVEKELFFFSASLGIEVAVEVVAGLAAEGYEGDAPDTGGFFGDGEELGGLGAVIFAAGVLPGGIGFEEKSVGWNLSEGFVQFAGGRGAAEGAAEGEKGTEVDPGVEVVGAAAPGVEEHGGRRGGADGGEEVVPDVADGVEGAGALKGAGELELAVKDLLLRGVGGVGELTVEADFADAGAGEAVEEIVETGLPVVGAVGKPGVEPEVGVDGGVFGEAGDLWPVVGGGAVDEVGVDGENGGAGADVGETAVGHEFLKMAVGIGPAFFGGGWGGGGACAGLLGNHFQSSQCRGRVVNLPLRYFRDYRDGMTWTIYAFYKFFAFPGFDAWREPLLAFCGEQGLCGSILLAAEGVNGTMAGPAEGMEALKVYLEDQVGTGALEVKVSTSAEKPFRRTKVKLKSEIVHLGRPDLRPGDARVGRYVEPKDWNALIAQEGVRLIDTRNDFEVRVGTFAGAENPHTEAFSEFPGYVDQALDPKRDKKVAMFCTGGIRCEKATAHLLEQGFEEVYHLKGGILKYLEEVPEAESLWRGECFVFDDRVTVNHRLEPGETECCRGCWNPLRPEDRLDPRYEEGVSCPLCFDRKSPERLAAARERERQRKLAMQRREACQRA